MPQKPLALETELYRFRDKLLDSSLRNPLLNYRTSQRKTIEITPTLADEAYLRLVAETNWLRIVPSAIQQENTASKPSAKLQTSVGIATEPEPIVDHKLIANCSAEKFDGLLRGVQRDAKTSIEETGINYLHLAIGFLHWTDSNSNESELRRAPLILIPVQLDQTIRAGGGLEYKITWNEDELQSNTSLRKKLESDFAIQLPDYDDAQPPSVYFDQVRTAIQARTAWKVREEMLLGFFSFHKLSMFVDLDPKLWSGSSALDESSLASKLISGSNDRIGDGLYAPDYQIDEHPVAQTIELPLDADSSQLSALSDIADGKSLVIEGPPGTGKSQTIANAIANAMEQGKTVLFVAEKLAALEVVHKRLTQAGLADFCLELHGHAVSPKNVYESLANRLASSQAAPPTNAQERTHHQTYRSKLHAYLRASSKRLGPYDEPLYDVFWRVVQLRQNQTQLLRDIPVESSVDLPGFDEAIQSLEGFANASSQYEKPQESAWWGFFPKDLTPAESDRIVQLLPSLEETAQALDRCLGALMPILGPSKTNAVSFLGAASSAALQPLLSKPPVNSKIGFAALLEPQTESRALEIDQLVRDSSRYRSTLDVHLEPAGSDFQQVLHRFADYSDNEWQTLPLGTEISKLSEYQVWPKQVENLLGELFPTIENLKRLGFPDPIHLEDLERSIQAVHLMQHSAVDGIGQLPLEWFSDSSRKLIAEAQKRAEQLVLRQKQIQECVHLPSAPDSDRLLFLIKQYRNTGSSWFRWLSGSYRSLMKELGQFVTFPKQMPHAQCVELLESLFAFDKDLKAFRSNTALERLIGDRFQGIETSWEPLQTLSQWVHTAKKMGIDHRRANTLLAIREELQRKFPISQIKQRIAAIDSEFQQPCARGFGIDEDWHRKTRLTEIFTAVGRWKKGTEDIDDAVGSLKQGSRTKLQDLIGCVHAVRRYRDSAARIEQIRQDADSLSNQILQEAESGRIDFPKQIQWGKKLLQAGVPSHALASFDPTGTQQACEALLQAVVEFEKIEEDWNKSREKITGNGRTDASWMAFRDPCHLPRLDLGTEVQRLISESHRLAAWLAFCRMMERCKRAGVEGFAMAAATNRIDEARLSDAYKLAVFHRLAEVELESNEIGFQFTTAEMDDLRANFQRLDRRRIKSKQSEIASKVRQRMVPEGNGKGRVGEYTELSLIRHEIGKKSRHCKTRELMGRAGKAVQALKPCFLMSPLSLARYLPAGSIEFDMVIMDEASQIKPEDAIGAILRAKQLVVVGDPKQLPPTSFFDSIDDEIDDDDATQFDNAESVLEVAQRSFQPYRRLRWHYRSQHENLIQFSNVKFYDEDLVVFPSPSSTMCSLGVVYHHVEGATCVKGENLREAQKIVERIVEHAKQRTGESLGVATFNKKQTEMIDTLVLKACESDPEFAMLYTTMREGDDGFFVKNLENIQGDERDVIFISYTYGRGPTSTAVAQRFGPINTAMGWRRLNVMVTRARKRMEVFSSMHPSDIHGGPDKSRGVNAYRDFLEYASQGLLRETGSESGREPGSPFEESVAKVVESYGLEAVFQVGVAGYFIDIGVRRRQGDRSYLLGIECDGATYHSSRSARDRDRLREEIIQGRGWDLYRIWSTDWFLNQKAEEERLVKRLQQCIG